MPSLFRRKRSKKRRILLERKPHIARCLVPDAAFTAVPCSPMLSFPQGRTPMRRPVSAPVINVATQVEFSPRNLPRDQSLLSYDSDNSFATDPGYTTVPRSGRVVERAEVVVETSPAGRMRYPSPQLTSSRQASSLSDSSTLPSITPSPCSELEVDEAVNSHPRKDIGSTDTARVHSQLTPPVPVYAKVGRKNKRGTLSDEQGVTKREQHGGRHTRNDGRNTEEEVDVGDEMRELSETSYNSDEPDGAMQASEEESAGHVASSPLSSHCRPPSGPHMKRGVSPSPSAAKHRHPVSTGSVPLLLPSLAGLPVYNLQQQPQAGGDHSYLLSRTSPNGNIEYFTATPITTPTSLNTQFLPSPLLQPQGGVVPPVTPTVLFPPQANLSSDRDVSTVVNTRSSEQPPREPSMMEGVGSELETVRVERNKLKAELMSLKQQCQSMKDSADMKALEQAHKMKLIKQEHTSLLETMREINTVISSCPLANDKEGSFERLQEFSADKESFQGIPEKLQTILKSCQLKMDSLKTKCSRLSSHQQAAHLEAKHLQEIETLERKTLEQSLLSAKEENFRLQEQLRLERAKFAARRKEHRDLVGKLGSSLVKLREERHGIQMELFALNHSHSQLEEKLTHAYSVGQMSLEEHKRRIRKFERQLEESVCKNNSNQHVLNNHMTYLKQKNDTLSIQLSECQGKLVVLTAKYKAQEREIRKYSSRVTTLQRELTVSQEREAITADQLCEAVMELERAVAERDVLAELSHSHTTDYQFMPTSTATVRRKMVLEDFRKKLDSFKQQQLLQRQRVKLLLQECPRKDQKGVTHPDKDHTTETLQSTLLSQEASDTKANEKQDSELEWSWKASANIPQFTSTPKRTRVDQQLTN